MSSIKSQLTCSLCVLCGKLWCCIKNVVKLPLKMYIEIVDCDPRSGNIVPTQFAKQEKQAIYLKFEVTMANIVLLIIFPHGTTLK